MCTDGDAEATNNEECSKIETTEKVECCELEAECIRRARSEVVVDGEGKSGEEYCEDDSKAIFHAKDIDEDQVDEGDTHHTEEEFFIESCAYTQDETGLPWVFGEGSGECKACNDGGEGCDADECV